MGSTVTEAKPASVDDVGEPATPRPQGVGGVLRRVASGPAELLSGGCARVAARSAQGVEPGGERRQPFALPARTRADDGPRCLRPIGQRPGEGRLADPRLAREQDESPAPIQGRAQRHLPRLQQDVPTHQHGRTLPASGDRPVRGQP